MLSKYDIDAGLECAHYVVQIFVLDCDHSDKLTQIFSSSVVGLLLDG